MLPEVMLAEVVVAELMSPEVVLPEVVLAGLAGNDPAWKPSGSDQMPCQKPNGTRPSPAAMDDRNAAEVRAGSPFASDPAANTVVPGATTRSCRTACGSAWPAKTANAAPTMAATSVVSAAAASTTECAVILRTASGPRRLVTRFTIPKGCGWRQMSGSGLFSIFLPERRVDMPQTRPPAECVEDGDRVEVARQWTISRSRMVRRRYSGWRRTLRWPRPSPHRRRPLAGIFALMSARLGSAACSIVRPARSRSLRSWRRGSRLRRHRSVERASR